MAGRGRPKIEIDKETFEKLCYLQCTLSEIASFFKCSEDTIENWSKRTYKMIFSDIYKIYSAGGKISVRRWQFRAAENGNTSMLIWLGKQYLGQKDQQEIAVSHDDETIKEMNEYFNQKTSS